MILYKNNIVITPPKCGTFTISGILEPLNATFLYDQKDYNTMHQHIHEHIITPNKKVVMMVRNPYDRLVSSFFYWTRQDTVSKQNSIWDVDTRGQFLNSKMSFLEFVIWYDKEREKYKDFVFTALDHPTIPYYIRSLSESYQVCKASDYLRIENLQEDLHKIDVSIDSVPHYNKTIKRTNKDFVSMFDSQTLSIANKWCIPDAKKFGYEILK